MPKWPQQFHSQYIYGKLDVFGFLTSVITIQEVDKLCEISDKPLFLSIFVCHYGSGLFFSTVHVWLIIKIK